MKKRLGALFIAMVMTLTAVSSAFATNVLDMSALRNKDSLEISVNSEQEAAFVTTTLSIATKSFAHELESETRYSSFESDILVLDYYSSAPYGILRTWINYSADEYLNITSVSFYIGDKIYTFSDIADADWHYQFDDGIMEQVLIRYGATEDMGDFFSAVMDEVDKWGETYNDEQPYSPEIKMVLHGTKDVTATVGYGPLLDLYIMALNFATAGGSCADASPSTLTVTNANKS